MYPLFIRLRNTFHYHPFVGMAATNLKQKTMKKINLIEKTKIEKNCSLEEAAIFLKMSLKEALEEEVWYKQELRAFYGLDES